ncbi:MAG: response regulator transcription factor, partial [Spirochaetes bacterium]|nr:response regulator transcription factor [Spirochaetota bacterium]
MVEDDKTLANGIVLALRDADKEIEHSYNLETARTMLNGGCYALVILDVNLPDGSGLDLLKEIKLSTNTPVILLTANDMELDIVTGLELGADDYVTKPFSLAVLRARVNTQLRKKDNKSTKLFTFNELTLDFDKLIFMKMGVTLELSKIEMKLLKILVENKGITLERRVLVDRLWTDGAEYVDEN